MTIETIILIFLVFLASSLSITLHLPGLYSNLLFLGLPAIYLSYLSRKNIKQAFFYSLIVTPPIIFIVDYIMQQSHVWFVPTIFAFKVFNTVPIEQFIWGFLYTYLFVIFYKHFLDKNNTNLYWLANKPLRIFFIFWPIFISLVLIVLLYYGIIVPYLYLIMGILIILLPSAIIYFRYTKVFHKIIKTIPYNFTLSLVFELTALHLNQWSWPSKYYLCWIQIFAYKFPIEEFLFFIIMGSFIVLVYFKIWADDLA